MSGTPWSLVCSECEAERDPEGRPGTCAACGAPYLVRGPAPPPSARAALAGREWTMWRYREWLPLGPREAPVTLGEGGTPLLRADRDTTDANAGGMWIKDEAANPTGSFKARGLSAAVTRAVLGGATCFVVPTAGNAGVALAAYAARARVTARVYAPRDTPPRIVQQIERFGAELTLVDGHIGDCGRAARSDAATSGAVDVSTLREPYRIEGKKTMGIEVVEQLGWQLPEAVVYPTGGGTGIIGMWKCFNELRDAGWVSGPLPRMYAVQAEGCAPVVEAFERGLDRCHPPAAPHTRAYGLRVPAPLGGRLILRALRESRGAAVAVSEEALAAAADRLTRTLGIDAGPEGGAALAGYEALLAGGALEGDGATVVFNTGAGWLYRR